MKLYADNIDITAAVGSLTWQNTITELATTMSFEIAKIEGQFTSIYIPNVGSIISLVTNAEVFRGIVITVDDGSDNSNKYTVCDFGFYLNKSKETYQFNNISVNEVLKKMCSDFNIGIDSICDIPVMISKIFLDKTISDIIKEVLTEAQTKTGHSYNFDVTPVGLRVYKLGEIKGSPMFRLAENLPLSDSILYRGNVSHSISIDDMKNSVKIITGNEKGFSLKATAKDNESVTRFGLLQEVEKIDDDKAAAANETAWQRLKELSQQKETFSFEIIESMDSYSRAGSNIEVEGISYIIEGSSHSIKNGVHYVKLDLKRVMV